MSILFRSRVIVPVLFVCLACVSAVPSQDIGSELFGDEPARPPSTLPPTPDRQPPPSRDLGGFVAEPQMSGNSVLIEKCVIVPRAEFTLAAEESGRLMMGPELGEEIEEGKLVAKTDDTIAQHQRRVAYFAYQAEKAKTESDIEPRYAEKQAQVKEAAYRDGMAANSKIKNAISPEMLRERKFSWEAAKLGIEKSEHDMVITRAGAEVKFAEFEAAEAMVSRHEIKSPVTGVVQEVFRRKGEWVTPGDPIAKVVQRDRLRVHGYLSIEECAPHKAKGATVLIEIPSARDENGDPTSYAKVMSKVMHVGESVSDNDDYMVWAEFPNTPGMDYWPNTPGVTMKLEVR